MRDKIRRLNENKTINLLKGYFMLGILYLIIPVVKIG